MNIKTALATAATALLSIMASSAVAQTAVNTISGEILVVDGYYGYPGEPCNQYRRGYQDIMQGLAITVKNGKGDVISVVEVPPGINVDTGVETNSVESFVMCGVSIPSFDVPDSDFYVFELGRRGEITKSRQQMQEDNWQLMLSIGRS